MGKRAGVVLATIAALLFLSMSLYILVIRYVECREQFNLPSGRHGIWYCFTHTLKKEEK